MLTHCPHCRQALQLTTDQVAKLHRAGVDALLLDEGHIDTGLTSALAVYADLTLDS